MALPHLGCKLIFTTAKLPWQRDDILTFLLRLRYLRPTPLTIKYLFHTAFRMKDNWYVFSIWLAKNCYGSLSSLWISGIRSIHYSDVIMGTMASQITSLRVVYSAVYSGAVQRKQQSSASLAFVREIHQWPVNSPHKGPVTRKMFPFDDVIMVEFRVPW